MPPDVDIFWLAEYGIGVPKGGVATSGAEAEKIAKDIGRRQQEEMG